MATTITLNDVARCLAKRPCADTPGLSSPPSSKRARGDDMSSVMPGEGDLISPPATIPTLAGEASSSSTVPEKQHPQLGPMPQHINNHFSQLHLQQQQQQFRLQAQYQASAPQPKQEKPIPKEEYEDEEYEDDDDDDEDEDDLDDEDEEEEDGKGADADWDARSWNSGILPALPSGLTSAEVRAAREDEACGQSIEDTYKRTLSHFPNPAIMFPAPTLEFDFRIAVNLKPESTQVHGKCHKEITAVSSGTWSGSFGNGKITAGGYDLGQARGFRPIRIVEGAFVMQTSDEPPATLEMRTRGSLSGPCDVLDTLLSCREPKQIDCRKYGFRMFLTVKTSDKRYAEIVNCGLWVASGIWKGEQLIIDAFRVA